MVEQVAYRPYVMQQITNKLALTYICFRKIILPPVIYSLTVTEIRSENRQLAINMWFLTWRSPDLCGFDIWLSQRRPHQQQCRSNIVECYGRTILSTKSNAASTLLPFLATMSNEISSLRQSRNKLNMFNLSSSKGRSFTINSFDIVAGMWTELYNCCTPTIQQRWVAGMRLQDCRQMSYPTCKLPLFLSDLRQMWWRHRVIINSRQCCVRFSYIPSHCRMVKRHAFIWDSCRKFALFCLWKMGIVSLK